jgi:hypothetical protein
MKEEEWRDYLTLGLLNSTTGRAEVRYTLDQIIGVKDSYSANPGSSSGVGQFVFAMHCCCPSGTLMGQCAPGSALIPWGVCCYMYCNVNSACSQQCCVACTFSLGGTDSIYVALGSIGGCGAVVWRRIS